MNIIKRIFALRGQKFRAERERFFKEIDEDFKTSKPEDYISLDEL